MNNNEKKKYIVKINTSLAINLVDVFILQS